MVWWCVGGDGKVYGIPFSAESVLIIDHRNRRPSLLGGCSSPLRAPSPPTPPTTPSAPPPTLGCPTSAARPRLPSLGGPATVAQLGGVSCAEGYVGEAAVECSGEVQTNVGTTDTSSMTGLAGSKSGLVVCWRGTGRCTAFPALIGADHRPGCGHYRHGSMTVMAGSKSGRVVCWRGTGRCTGFLAS